MRAFIDTVFGPVISWLQNIYNAISDLSVPLARPLNISNYFGYFGMFGQGWIDFIETVCALAFIYGVAYIITSQIGLLIKFKDMIKWW